MRALQRFCFSVIRSGSTICCGVLLGAYLVSACRSSTSGRVEGAKLSDFNCDGSCERKSLTTSEVETIVKQAVAASDALSQKATVAVVDRVGNVLTVYQMTGSRLTVTIDGQISAVGGLEGRSNVASTLAAISKAGTAAYLSSQGNAFSTRTASQIIQEHFNPGEINQSGGPLFGVQFSQLPCSDVMVRNPDFDDGRTSGLKWSFNGSIGPRFLPLGLSGDAGGFPLYKQGDLVGGIGIEVDGLYGIDRHVTDFDNAPEERIALTASKGFEAPSQRIAPNVNLGKSLRYSDLRSDDISTPAIEAVTLDPADFVAVTEFSAASVTARAGVAFESAASGYEAVTFAGVPAARLVNDDGSERYPARSATSLGGLELTQDEVTSLLESALRTAHRTRAAIRRPLDSSARVSIFVVDQEGVVLGMIRSQDAPVFGTDVALQKARTAVFFSRTDAASLLEAEGFSLTPFQSVLGSNVFRGETAFSARAIANLARPFFPDGIRGSGWGPLSLPFPGDGAVNGKTWSPFNTGLQFDLLETRLFESLGLIGSATFPTGCGAGALQSILANGIQIFPGAVPLYRGDTLVGGLGVSGDGVDQDDLVAFYGASREGLNFADHRQVGDAVLGFNAPRAMRADRLRVGRDAVRLRYISCPEAAFLGSDSQRICGDL